METMRMEFEQLQKKFGSHSEAARQLGISIRHYARIRAGDCAHPLTMRVIREEIAKAKQEADAQA